MISAIKYEKETVEQFPFSHYVYKTTDDQELGLIIAYPQIKPNACILFIHGGGWRSGTYERLQPHAQYAALNGAVGVSISYRLINEENGTDVRDGLLDCIDALEFVRRTLFQRYGEQLYVIAAGDSAGGYYAAALGCEKIIDRVKKGVKRVDFVADLNGITDLTGKWNYAVSENHLDEKSKNDIDKDYSPIYNIGINDAPVLIIHGDKDKTVALSDAVDYHNALIKTGIKSELKILEGAAHAFILFDYRHENAYVAEILQWVITYLLSKGI